MKSNQTDRIYLSLALHLKIKKVRDAYSEYRRNGGDTNRGFLLFICDGTIIHRWQWIALTMASSHVDGSVQNISTAKMKKTQST